MNTDDNSETNDTFNAASKIDVDFHIKKAAQNRNEAICNYTLTAIKAVLGLGTSVKALLRLPKIAQ